MGFLSVFDLPADLPLWMPRVIVGLMLLIGGGVVFFTCRALRSEGKKAERAEKKDPSEGL